MLLCSRIGLCWQATRSAINYWRHKHWLGGKIKDWHGVCDSSCSFLAACLHSLFHLKIPTSLLWNLTAPISPLLLLDFSKSVCVCPPSRWTTYDRLFSPLCWKMRAGSLTRKTKVLLKTNFIFLQSLHYLITEAVLWNQTYLHSQWTIRKLAVINNNNKEKYIKNRKENDDFNSG